MRSKIVSSKNMLLKGLRSIQINYNRGTEWSVVEQITASVPTRTVAGSNLDHRWLLSLGRQLSRERSRHPPTDHGRNLRVPNLKFCQNQTHVFTKNLQYPPPQLKIPPDGLIVPLQP